jgi:hypothetical protein
MVHVELNLPSIPDNIKQDIFKFLDEYLLTWSPTPNDGYREVYGDEEINIVKRKVLVGWENIDLTNFIASVCPQIKEISLFLLINDTPVPGFMPPHTDFNRELAVNYILDTGGDNVETCFFEQVYEPPIIVKDGFIMPRYFNEKTLTRTSSVVFKKDSWVAFDSQKPHCVNNITGKRILISMTMDYNLAGMIETLPHIIKNE